MNRQVYGSSSTVCHNVSVPYVKKKKYKQQNIRKTVLNQPYYWHTLLIPRHRSYIVNVFSSLSCMQLEGEEEGAQLTREIF